MQWKSTFIYKAKPLYYNRIPVNNSAERSIEIPIAFDFLANLKEKNKILEVGNVLHFYENSLSEYIGIRSRRIVDKFERCPGVNNVDLMDLPSEEKYEAIVSISTVEHIGQGVEPSGYYGEDDEVGDLEAPLKAIAKIYDLLVVGGQALITVPFGKLINGEWYIQFSEEYLGLLECKYGIPQKAILKSFFKRFFLEPPVHNPFQIWLEVEEKQLIQVNYNCPWPCANGIAVIELNKIEPFSLKLYLPPTSLPYRKTVYKKPVIYSSLIEDEFLALLKKTRDINLIFFLDWEQSEEELATELELVLKTIFHHPDQKHILLLLEYGGISEEEAALFLSSVTMSLLMEEDINDVTDEDVALIGQMTRVQWEALSNNIQYRLVLNKYQPKVENISVEKIPLCEVDSLPGKRICRLKTDFYKLQ
ncbi:hypothetical protein [Coleofasciculus sp. G2-EDA-02]|uniref:hypothetical protein n=1 Tax=Coleofasciculus sp. G2-EDA-02 TaxID=3069529 RepID=UPI0032F562A7